jgi:DNA-binding FadR family transcriptional regulator
LAVDRAVAYNEDVKLPKISFSLLYMYVIEILLKNVAMPMSVQRKTAEEATTVYQQVLAAMQAHEPKFLELTCDRQPEKKIAVMTDAIVAAQMYEKSGAASSGKAPGFAVAAVAGA